MDTFYISILTPYRDPLHHLDHLLFTVVFIQLYNSGRSGSNLDHTDPDCLFSYVKTIYNVLGKLDNTGKVLPDDGVRGVQQKNHICFLYQL